ncbi:hypothetical protein D9M71_635250 [compost metagenome]
MNAELSGKAEFPTARRFGSDHFAVVQNHRHPIDRRLQACHTRRQDDLRPGIQKRLVGVRAANVDLKIDGAERQPFDIHPTRDIQHAPHAQRALNQGHNRCIGRVG